MAYIAEETIQNQDEKDRVVEVLDKINNKNKKHFWKIKRSIDVLVALIALLIFGVPMLVIALIIFIGDGHNPIFYQQRVGRYGKVFKMYKFRTMVPDAEKLRDALAGQNEMDGPVFKIENDPRITKVGKLLRKTGLDELPQFFNVLKGNMTLIGPRPPLPEEVKQSSEYHKIRLLVTPGITCLWQVHPNRNAIPFDEWVAMDIDYVLHRNLLLDLKIIFLTVYAMICGEGQ